MFTYLQKEPLTNESVWPSGKVLGLSREAEGPIPLRLSLLFKKVVTCGHCLETLSLTAIK